jgi:hypothetical protein
MILMDKRRNISIVFYLVIATTILAQTPPPPNNSNQIQVTELEQAKKIVIAFCTDWKALKFDSMYTLMSDAAMKSLSKTKFLNIYGVKSDNSGKLKAFTLKEALPNESGIVIKIELTFIKQNPPVAVNGIYNFHLIKENGKWKVKAVVSPILPPKPENVIGSGHPGE